MPIILTGRDLTAERLTQIAEGCHIDLCADGLARMDLSHQILQRAINDKRAIYGVTTGLGPKVVDSLTDSSIDSFSINTLRGRAHALGAPLAPGLVRGALAVRVNTLLIGATGVRSALALFLADCLNHEAIPVIGESASIGAADLLWGASSGLALCGEGKMWRKGEPADASELLQDKGLSPWKPNPREGLALASHSGFSSAIAAIGVQRVSRIYHTTQTSACLSIEGFRASLSPIDPGIVSLYPDPDLARVANDLRHRLQGSLLFNADNCRRLQDPLSLRNILQVQTAVYRTLQQTQRCVLYELNTATDNPSVIIEDQSVLSHGGYLAPQLSLSLTTLALSTVHLAAQQVARLQKLLFRRFSELPNGLAPEDADIAGLGPIMKVAEALLAEITHLATPPVVYPSPSADGVEDTITHVSIPAKSLLAIAGKLEYLTAIELLVACHAIRLRGVDNELPHGMRGSYRAICDVSPRLRQDRSLTAELEILTQCIADGNYTGR